VGLHRVDGDVKSGGHLYVAGGRQQFQDSQLGIGQRRDENATGSSGLRGADLQGRAGDPFQERVGQRVGRMLDQVAGHLGHGRHDRIEEAVDARLSYTGGDRSRGRRSLAAAVHLAEPEQLRLPFVLERSWIGTVLRREPELARAHRSLLAPTLRDDQLRVPEQAASLSAEPLSEREREVLRHVSQMLTTLEVASEMNISANTVKTHVQHICRKLATTRRGEAVRRARQLDLI
jgi:DNA-binding CsgD family transcriptional regulator